MVSHPKTRYSQSIYLLELVTTRLSVLCVISNILVLKLENCEGQGQFLGLGNLLERLLNSPLPRNTTRSKPVIVITCCMLMNRNLSYHWPAWIILKPDILNTPVGRLACLSEPFYHTTSRGMFKLFAVSEQVVRMRLLVSLSLRL